MKDKNRWTPKLPDEDALRKQSLRYIAMNTWECCYLVEMASAQLALKAAYTDHSQWYDLYSTPTVPIHAFNGALASGPVTEWPTVRRKHTAKGIIYLNLTLRTWAEAAHSPADSDPQVASEDAHTPANSGLLVAFGSR